MTFETETVLDRRRLRRRLSLWRGLAVIAALLAFGLVVFSSAEGVGLAERRQIARVSVEGLITEDRDQLKLFKRLADDKQVAAVILFINSPGGTTTGGEALFEAIRELCQGQAGGGQLGTVAASAAYIAGLATDHIVARGNTITGSVGVIFQWAEVSQLLDKLGVKMNEIKSGPLKANPSPFQPLDEAGKAAAEQMVAESQRWFVGLVATRRGIDTASVAGPRAGPRLLRPRGAGLQAHRPDRRRARGRQIPGGEAQHPQGPQGRRLEAEARERLGPVACRSAALGRLIGERAAGSIGQLLDADDALGRLRLDGLVSVWQGSER